MAMKREKSSTQKRGALPMSGPSIQINVDNAIVKMLGNIKRSFRPVTSRSVILDVQGWGSSWESRLVSVLLSIRL